MRLLACAGLLLLLAGCDSVPPPVKELVTDVHVEVCVYCGFETPHCQYGRIFGERRDGQAIQAYTETGLSCAHWPTSKWWQVELTQFGLGQEWKVQGFKRAQ